MVRNSRIFCTVLLTISPAVLWSQTQKSLTEGQRELLRQRQQKEQEAFRRLQETERRFRPPDPQLKKLKRPLPKKPYSRKSKKCIVVRAIQIERARLLSASRKAALSADFTGRCLSHADLNLLLSKITAYYIKKGFVTTRAYLPPQSLRDGILMVRVIEGTVERIRFASDKTGYLSEIFTAFPFLKGHRLNLRPIEQGLDQLNRLQSNAARVHFYPGKEPGATEVVIDNPRKKAWSGMTSFDNTGSVSTGEATISANAAYDSLLGLNDSWSFDLQKNARDFGENYSRSQSLKVSLPFGYITATAFLTEFEYQNELGSSEGSFRNSGTSLTQNIYLETVIYRNQQGKTSLSYENKYRISQNYIDDTLLLTSSRSLRTSGLSLSHSCQLWGGYCNARLSHHLGSLSAPNGVLQSPEAPDLYFNKTSLSLGYSLPFRLKTQRLSLRFSFQGQTSPDILFPGEQFNIGGLYSVRGFKRQSLGGDKGFYLRNELSWTLPLRQGPPSPAKSNGVTHSLFLAYDLGLVDSNVENTASGQLEGAALGIRSQTEYINVSMTYSQALRRPGHFKPETAWWLSMGVRF